MPYVLDQQKKFNVMVNLFYGKKKFNVVLLLRPIMVLTENDFVKLESLSV
jgi:hypothetical protein